MLTNITIKLLVSGPPAIKLLNTSDFYQIGKHYQLDCLAIGYPKADIWWRWHSCSTPENCSPSDSSQWTDIETDVNSSLLLLSNSELIIRPNISLLYLNQVSLQVVANQSGAYRCYANNTNSIPIYTQTSFIVTGIVVYVKFIIFYNGYGFDLVFVLFIQIFYSVNIYSTHKSYCVI